MDLPHFTYHPDPIATGSVVPSDIVCKVCGQARGYIYTGPVYGQAVRELRKAVCPWCIADGSAHDTFGADFVGFVGDFGWDRVSTDIVEEVTYRTPGFIPWQSDRWFTHCGDAAEFLGPMGRKELEAIGPEAVEAIHQECGYEGDEWQDYYEGLDRDGSPTAYLFRCRHCGALGGYSDCD